jgi:DNA-binding response OmpR family regulator
VFNVTYLQSGFDGHAGYDDQAASQTAGMLAGLVEILEQAGYACACAATIEAARECMRRLAPELIIADTNLGGVSGVSLCESLVKEESLDAPLMYLSDTQLPNIIRRSHCSGAAYHIRKPCDPEVLVSLVGKALAKNRFEPAGI